MRDTGVMRADSMAIMPNHDGAKSARAMRQTQSEPAPVCAHVRRQHNANCVPNDSRRGSEAARQRSAGQWKCHSHRTPVRRQQRREMRA